MYTPPSLDVADRIKSTRVFNFRSSWWLPLPGSDVIGIVIEWVQTHQHTATAGCGFERTLGETSPRLDLVLLRFLHNINTSGGNKQFNHFNPFQKTGAHHPCP